MKKNVVLFGVIALAFAGAGAYFSAQRLAPVAPKSAAVATLLGQSMMDAQDQPHAMSQWQGKTLIVNFWATWCTPCVEEMPELVALQKELAGANTQVIGMSIDSKSAVREFAAKHHITYPLYIAGLGGTDLMKQFGNQAGGLPYTVIVRPDGSIKKQYLGRLKMAELKADLAAP